MTIAYALLIRAHKPFGHIAETTWCALLISSCFVISHLNATKLADACMQSKK